MRTLLRVLVVLVPWAVPALVALLQQVPVGAGVVELRGRWEWADASHGTESRDGWKALMLPGLFNAQGVDAAEVLLRRDFEWSGLSTSTALLSMGELRTGAIAVSLNGAPLGDLGAGASSDRAELGAFEALFFEGARLIPGRNQLVLKVRGAADPLTGIRDQRMVIGPAAALGAWHLRTARWESFLRLSPLLVFALLSVLLLVLRHLGTAPKERARLALALGFMGAASLYLIAQTGLGLVGWVPLPSRFLLVFVAIAGALTCFVEFGASFFLDAPTRLVRLNRAVTLVMVIVGVLEQLIFSSVFVYLAFIPWVTVLALDLCVRAGLALRGRRDVSAWLVASAGMVVVVTALGDLITDLGVWSLPRLAAKSMASAPMLVGALVVARFIGLAERHKQLSRSLAQTNLDLAQALVDAREASRVKGQFLANVSHELRTPLNSIINIPGGLLDDFLERDGQVVFAGDPSETRNFLVSLHLSGTRLLGVVNQVLDFSKLEAGRMLLHREQVIVRAVLSEVFEPLGPLAAQKGITLTSSGDLDGAFEGDSVKVAQVLLNLGGNAIKFSPAGSRVELRVHEAPQTVQFEVVDAGPGIAPEHQAKIFESFTQVDGSLTRAHGGTGLGLSIAKRLVELHGGTLRVRSALGRGSTFIAQFPRTAAKVEAPPSPSKTLSRPATIVVVDDEPMVVETLRLSLRHLALVEVIGVNDPEQALATIARHQPSLVVLDVMMPGTSGLTILRQLREAPTSKELPVLVLSAFATSRAKAEELGARWLAKPWNAGELAATVTQLAALELRSPHPPAR